MSEWKLYKRVGEIEARPWTDADVQMARGYGTVGDGCLVSVSDADLHAAKVTPPIGYVARNPANHADQWYIAPAYFAKHYASTPPIVGEVMERKPVECRSNQRADTPIDDQDIQDFIEGYWPESTSHRMAVELKRLRAIVGEDARDALVADLRTARSYCTVIPCAHGDFARHAIDRAIAAIASQSRQEAGEEQQ